MGGMKVEHARNISLLKILQTNEKIMSLRGASSASSKPTDQRTSSIITAWIELQDAVNCYMDSAKDPNPLSTGAAQPGIRQLLERKQGLFRMNMMGKRVNFCCRSVISPDPFIGTNEIGIPVQFAKELHYVTPVTPWNVKFLRQLVKNGPNIYPGEALSIFTRVMSCHVISVFVIFLRRAWSLCDIIFHAPL